MATGCGSPPSITARARFPDCPGIADYQLVDSQGATEGTVKNLTAEAIADITSTGETLRANHLKMLSDGLVHRSQATLYAARTADWQGAPAATLRELATRLGLDLPLRRLFGLTAPGGR